MVGLTCKVPRSTSLPERERAGAADKKNAMLNQVLRKLQYDRAESCVAKVLVAVLDSSLVLQLLRYE